MCIRDSFSSSFSPNEMKFGTTVCVLTWTIMLTVQKLKCGDVINKVEIKNGYTKRFVFCCCFRIGFWNVFKTSLIHHFLRISLIIADVGVSVNHKWLNEKVCVIFNRFFITNSTKFNLFLMWGGVSRLFRCSVSTQDLGLSLIHIWRCRRYSLCRSRWSPYH